MAGYRADAVFQGLDMAMSTLRDNMKSVPTRFQKFRKQHEALAEALATLQVAIAENRLNFSADSASAGKKVIARARQRTTRASK